METQNEHKTQISQDKHHQNTWGFIAKSDQESIEETKTISNESLSISSNSSLDTADDASSPLSSLSSSPNSNGSSALDLSDLMSHLPIKRGLSKFYHGKSESFTSLARVMSIEDLPKRSKNPYSKMRKMKSNSKSYGGGGLDSFKTHTLPKPIISKKFSSFLKQRIPRSTLILGQQDN